MSVLANLGLAEFLRQFTTLPPPGRAFSGDPDTVQAQVFTPPSDALANLHAGAMRLLEIEADPTATTELLQEWEFDWGLPDPCTAAGGSITQRRAALNAKIASLGGQSIAYYVGVAAAFGYTITITERRPFRLGRTGLGSPMGGIAWTFTWVINAPATTIQYFRLGTSLGQPFATWGDAEFECRMRSIMPAHTVLLFSYGGTLEGGSGFAVTEAGAFGTDETGDFITP